MTRVYFAGIVALFLSCTIVRSATSAPPPNIVFILADDLGWNGIGPYGNKDVSTPHLDRLAREGITFHRAYAEPQCSPTRGAFFSGQWPARTGMFAVTHEMDPVAAPLTPPPHSMGLPPTVASLALMLRAAGYTNGLSGKWHIADNYNAAALRSRDGGKYFDGYGFDFVGEGANSTPKDKSVAGITDDMLGFIERSHARPFFAFVSHQAPHAALEPPAALVEKYVARGHRRSSRPDTVFSERPTADYYATLDHLDTHIGRILALLDRLGLARNTLVIFASDNGGLNRMADMAPLRGSKGQTYEGGIRIPLLARWPARIPAGSSNTVPVHVVDWYPTFAALAGAKLPAAQRLDGENLVPVLTGTGRPARDTLWWHTPTYTTPFARTPSSTIMRGDWKLLHFFGDYLATGPDSVPETAGVYGQLVLGARTELYNLATDPGETTDLAAKNPAKVAELMADLRELWAETNAALPTPNPAWRPGNPTWWQRAPAPRAKSD